LSANFRGRGSSTNEFWHQKTRVPGLSRGVVCVILRLAVLMEYRRVTNAHTQTHRQTHDDGYYPRRASSARVKTQNKHPGDFLPRVPDLPPQPPLHALDLQAGRLHYVMLCAVRQCARRFESRRQAVDSLLLCCVSRLA